MISGRAGRQRESSGQMVECTSGLTRVHARTVHVFRPLLFGRCHTGDGDDSFTDAHAILFPERAPLFLIGLVLPVLSLLPALIFGLQAGASFACMLACYYLSYEWLHLAYHAPPHSWLGSLPGVAVLRRHHQVHHSQALMGKWNFNITWPIADLLCGTTYRPPQQQQVHAQ